IPLGLPALFLGATPRTTAPPPRALFLSNPLRSLDWLLQVWCDLIRPRTPQAELHIFAGAAIYGAVGAAKAQEMAAVLETAASLAAQGVVLRGPLPKADLVREMTEARVFLYRGDPGETFCYAAAEAQAMGLPGVVEDIACMAERVVDGQTGFVVKGQAAFADAAHALLNNDHLWQAQHQAALRLQGRWSWDDAAQAFENLI
ncbi:MAG TPA: glycosyltransferase, partial [Rhodospirillaceae bacterium]|nr:glycosyltransferase [Rhodospirillaceae bacterium]